MLGTAILAILLTVGSAVAGGDIECRCRYAGKDYAEGRCICIHTSAGARYACCGKVLNNTSWSFSQRSCPIAEVVDDETKPGSSNDTTESPVTDQSS